MSLTSPTPADFAKWMATATDTTASLMERQLAASCVIAAFTQAFEASQLLAAELKALKPRLEVVR